MPGIGGSARRPRSARSSHRGARGCLRSGASPFFSKGSWKVGYLDFPSPGAYHHYVGPPNIDDNHDGESAIADTPVGVFHVYRQVDGLVTDPLGQLWRPKFFDGGFAIHGDSSVPPVPGLSRVRARQ